MFRCARTSSAPFVRWQQLLLWAGLTFLILHFALYAENMEPAQANRSTQEVGPATVGWEPKTAPLMTEWAGQIDVSHPLNQHPRPQLYRKDWKILNGLWDYKIQQNPLPPLAYDGKILVPYCVESAMSGVMQDLTKDDYLWYRLRFKLPEAWINGHQVTVHKGGYDSFTVDATAFVTFIEEELVVRVRDPSEHEPIPLGKQWSSKPHRYIFYTATSGIWQSVWLEAVGHSHTRRLHMTPDIDSEELRLTVESDLSLDAKVVVKDGDNVVSEMVGETNRLLKVKVPSPKLWSPKSPFLYNLEVQIVEGNDIIDKVESYFGMRKVEIRKVGNFQKIFLNNAEYPFQVGPLDQGYWPDTIYTPPTEEAIKWELQQIQDMGFNMIRKHIKVEPHRWYYWADKMGFLVWQDFPSMSDKYLTEDLEEAKAEFKRQMILWMDRLHNHPSIILWVVFNEGWGQFDTVNVTKQVMEHDTSRLVTGASGWYDFPVGHVADAHVYPGPTNSNASFAPDDKNRTPLVGEMWGQSMIIWGHNWFGDAKAKDDTRGSVKSDEEFLKKYEAAIDELVGLTSSHGYTAAVMTQTTDVEAELNGFFTYDRKVAKVSVAALKRINAKILKLNDL